MRPKRYKCMQSLKISSRAFQRVFTCKIDVDTAENEPSKVSDFIPTQAIRFHIRLRSRSATQHMELRVFTLDSEGGKQTAEAAD